MMHNLVAWEISCLFHTRLVARHPDKVQYRHQTLAHAFHKLLELRRASFFQDNCLHPSFCFENLLVRIYN